MTELPDEVRTHPGIRVKHVRPVPAAIASLPSLPRYLLKSALQVSGDSCVYGINQSSSHLCRVCHFLKSRGLMLDAECVLVIVSIHFNMIHNANSHFLALVVILISIQLFLLLSLPLFSSLEYILVQILFYMILDPSLFPTCSIALFLLLALPLFSSLEYPCFSALRSSPLL